MWPYIHSGPLKAPAERLLWRASPLQPQIVEPSHDSLLRPDTRSALKSNLVISPFQKRFLSGRFLAQLETRDCGDFCGDPSCISTNLGTGRIICVQLAKYLSERVLQGFLYSVQQLSEVVEKGFLNRGSGVRIPPGLPSFQQLSRPAHTIAL